MPRINLEKSIQKILKEYGDEAKRIVDEDVPKVSRKARRQVAAGSPNSTPEATGAYKADWRQKVDKNTRTVVSAVVYNKSHYQLTHLLEEGHVNWVKGKRDGSPKEPDAFFSHQISRKRPFMQAIPHITPVEEKTSRELVNMVLRDLKKI